jgi:hypothetical protein
MSPSQLLVWLVVAVGFGFAGWGIGKGKGRPALGGWLGFLFGLIGVIIIACVPKTQAAKLAEAQRQYQLQAQAAWNAGYPYPPQQPYAPGPYAPGPYAPGPYAPYPPPAQDPYAQQEPPGQWQQEPPPASWEQPPPNPWPGPQQ